MKISKHITHCLPVIAAILVSVTVHAGDASEAAFASAAKYTVKIETTVRQPTDPGDELGVFSGAGFVVDAQRGWVVTNAHVTTRSPATIRLRFRNGAWIAAKRVYVDPYLDIAVITAADRAGMNGVTAATLACDGFPAIGHPVGAFGHPWDLDFTGTRGIVAGVSDRFEAGALLTDAPINDGNSGGPLISLATGKVVGVNTSAIEAKGVQNLNFAVAAHYACKILDLLRAGHDPSPPDRSLVFFADSGQTGVLKVARNFMPPGYLALQPGDVVKAVISEAGPITRESEFVHALRGRLDRVSLRIERGGAELVVSGRLPAVEKILGRKTVYASGVVFGQARRFDASEINFSRVAACQVEQGSLGESAGFEKCDAIEAIDGEPVRDLDQVYRQLASAQTAGKPVNIVIKRVAGLQGKNFFAYHEISLPVEELGWVRVED
jgi:S1-C subfamily serine protease